MVICLSYGCPVIVFANNQIISILLYYYKDFDKNMLISHTGHCSDMIAAPVYMVYVIVTVLKQIPVNGCDRNHLN